MSSLILWAASLTAGVASEAQAHGLDVEVAADAQGIEVRALYADGEPVSGARVLISAAVDGDSALPPANALTDANGAARFPLSRFPPRHATRWRVEVSDRQHHHAEVEIELDDSLGERARHGRIVLGDSRRRALLGSWPLAARIAVGLGIIALVTVVIWFLKRGAGRAGKTR